MKGTFLFVHGTGVRESGYNLTLLHLQNAFRANGLDCEIKTCLWGDIGSKPPKFSVPEVQMLDGASAGLSKEAELARWELLYRDPWFELQLLKDRPKRPNAPFSSSRPDLELWDRIVAYQPSLRFTEQLKSCALAEAWCDAWLTIVVKDKTAREVLSSSPDEIGEPAQAVARSIIAQLTNLAAVQGIPSPDAKHREELVWTLIDDWDARVAGIGAYLTKFFGSVASRAVTPVFRHWRGSLTQSASPAAGDILFYQARGDGIRNYIGQRIDSIDDSVVLLAHSLGGIACIDTLVETPRPKVTHLITVGSQAPFLYEIGALKSLDSNRGDKLPAFFPPWLNIYDARDFLSYLAEPVFGADKVTDVRVDSGQPFPQSHSAYWSNQDTWEAV